MKPIITTACACAVATLVSACGGGGGGTQSGTTSGSGSPQTKTPITTTFPLYIPVQNYFRGVLDTQIFNGVATINIGGINYTGTAQKTVLNQPIVPNQPYVLGISGGTTLLLYTEMQRLLISDIDKLKSEVGSGMLVLNISRTVYNINITPSRVVNGATYEIFLMGSSTAYGPGTAYARYEDSYIDGVYYRPMQYFIEGRKFINNLPGSVRDGDSGEFFTEFRCRVWVSKPEECRTTDRIDVVNVGYKAIAQSDSVVHFEITSKSLENLTAIPSTIVYRFDGLSSRVKPHSEKFVLNGNLLDVTY